MNDEEQKILDIFDEEVKLKDPLNQEKQEIIKRLLIETFSVEGINDEIN